MFLTKHKGKLIAAVIVLAVLVFAWLQGGTNAGHNGIAPVGSVQVTDAATPSPVPSGASMTNAPTPAATETPLPQETEAPIEATPIPTETEAPSEEPSGYHTAVPDPTEAPLQIEIEEPDEDLVAMLCTLSVRCDTVLANWEALDEAKRDLVPANGVIFFSSEVVFYEGENVFNILQREMKRAGIHMEFVNTPMYNTVYIKGIQNLYQFDCGELSGWLYSVNGRFPGYGASQYILQAGDVVEWAYSCDLGRDINNGEAVEGQ